MPSSVFTIPDTSPTIQYSPFADTLSTPNLTAGWNPYFTSSAFATSLGQEGQGTSQHITSLEGAGLAVQWFGTGIQLYGNITNNANYSIFVDGAPVPINMSTSATGGGLLFSLFGIPQASHLLSLTVGIGTLPGRPMNTSMLVFDSALVQYSDEDGTQPTNQTLPDNNIDFRGNWSTHADISSRVSTEQGDTARIQFLGQAFFLTGTTSPTSGNYSITLDNATATHYSAQSSFTAHDSLLFYATGLLGNMTHDIILRNEGGGELGVANGGWGVRADGPILPTPIQPSPPPPTTTANAVGASTSFPKGTIAAFALAGILAFLLLSGILFFFLVYRPRRQRKRQQRASERYSRSAWGEGEGGMKERERLTLNTAVLDIRHPPPHGEGEGEEDLVPMRGHRDSTKSGFARWKREMQYIRLGNGIMFRHSDSVHPGQSGVQREGTTASSKSSSSKFSITSSFKVRKAWTKKGKQRAVSGQSGQSQRKHSQRYSQRYSQRQKAWYALDLPLKETSPVEKKEEEELGEPSESHESGIATLSYISTPSSPKPPLYSFAGLGLRSKASKKKMAGNASPPSGPRTVSESTGSATVGHEASASASRQQQQQRGIQLKPIRRQDRGSVLPEEEERESERGVLGPATARAALRGLSPRTSQSVSTSFGVQGERPRTAEAVYPPMLEGRHAYALVDEPRRPQSAMPLQQQQPQPQQGRKPRGPRGLPVPPIQTSNFDTPRAPADAPVTALQPTSKVTSPDEVVEVNNGVFLSVRELSPFRIDFPSRPVSGVIGEKRSLSRPVSVVGVTSPSTRVSGLSHVRFDSNTADVGEARRASFGNLLGGGGAEQQQLQPDFVQGSSGLFRLTPLTAMQPPSIEGSPSPPESSSAGVTSFLDLTHSSDVSLRSRSLRTTDSQERDRAWEMLKAEAREKSRWSMTTGPSMAPAHEHEQSAGEGSNISQGSSTFPIPFQVNMPPSPSPAARPETYSSSSYEGAELHVHPVMGNIEDPSSPTESIPFSVSDLNFRHDSGSESDTREASDSQFPSHPPLPGSDVSTPMSTPNFIFQRVVGMTPPTSSRPTQSSYPYLGSPLQPLRGYHTDSSRSNTGLDNSR